MSYARRILWAVVLVLLLNLYGAAPRAALRQNYLAYSVLKPYLRKPKVRNRTTREEKKRRSAFHKQLHKELRMKYWERLDPAVNTIINYKSKTEPGPVIDPKRAFVVQEVIPQLVKLENQQVNCTLTAEQSESFDRRAGLKLYCDIKAVFSTIADNINNNDVFTDFHLMASQDQLLKLQADVDYIMSLVNAREEPEPSTECIEYCNHIEQLAQEEPIKFLAHSYYIIKDWHLTRRHFLARFRYHLKLVRKMKAASFDNDCDTFEKTLNKTAINWTRTEKNIFIYELQVAQNMAQNALTSAIIYPCKASYAVSQICETSC